MAAPPTPPVPETLPQPLAVLRCRGEGAGAGGPETTYYILGTAHVSAESCEDVTTLIRAVKPQARTGGAAGGPSRQAGRQRCGPRLQLACVHQHAPTQRAPHGCRHAQRSPPLQAQVVLIELCSERRPVLSLDKIREPSLGEVVTEIRTGRATPFQAVYSW
mgnify:CR=1 FL=1